MKMHSTPFRVINGLLCGGDYTPLHLIPADYILPDSEENLRTDLAKFEKDGFNHIELRLDETGLRIPTDILSKRKDCISSTSSSRKQKCTASPSGSTRTCAGN